MPSFGGAHQAEVEVLEEVPSTGVDTCVVAQCVAFQRTRGKGSTQNASLLDWSRKDGSLEFLLEDGLVEPTLAESFCACAASLWL